MTKRIQSKVPAAAIFFSALLLSSCGGSEETSDNSTASTASEEAAKTDQTLEEAAETAANNAQEAADSASDKMANVTQQAADSAGDAMDDAKAAAEDALADASDAMEATTAAVQGGDGGSEYASLTGDATKGRRVFAKCMSCHRVQEGVNLVGPSLYGIVGRDAGTIEGFNYSAANANSGITWTEEIMFEYLKAPQEYIPGTRMIFPGLPSAQDRADVIAYLKSESE